MYLLTYYHSQQLVYLHVVLHHTVTTTYFSYIDQWHVNMVPVEQHILKMTWMANEQGQSEHKIDKTEPNCSLCM